jgi:hypothetical protein
MSYGKKTVVLPGTKFNRLTVLEEFKGEKFYRLACECECDGKIVTPAKAAVVSGNTKSCGCLTRDRMADVNRNYHALEPGLAALNSLFYSYRKWCASNRGYVFELTLDQFREITSSPCFYCGRPPSQAVLKHRASNGDYLYNGIDRLDPRKGYVQGNVVACCKRHNFMKRTMSYDEFMAEIVAIVRQHPEILSYV